MRQGRTGAPTGGVTSPAVVVVFVVDVVDVALGSVVVGDVTSDVWQQL